MLALDLIAKNAACPNGPRSGNDAYGVPGSRTVTGIQISQRGVER